jgi:tetratricopeptide (TPR) repeat protein
MENAMKKSHFLSFLLTVAILSLVSGCVSAGITSSNVYSEYKETRTTEKDYEKFFQDAKPCADNADYKDAECVYWIAIAYEAAGYYTIEKWGGTYGKAVAYYNNAAEYFRKYISLVEYKDGVYVMSLPYLNDFKRAKINFLTAKRKLAYAYYNAKRYKEAVDALQDYRKLEMIYSDWAKDAENGSGWSIYSTNVFLASSYEQLGMYDNAIEAAKMAIQVEPKYANAFVILGRVYSAKKQYDEGISALKRAIELDPNYAAAYEELGKAYFGKRQYNDAVSYYKKAIEVGPKVVDRYISLADLYRKMGNFGDAINTLKKALEIAPNNVRLYSELTNSYMAAGRFDDAIQVIDKAVEDVYVIRGIGITPKIEDKYPLVVSVVPSGPAKKAGIEVGDRIIKIDGQSTKGWDINKTVENIRGQEGTQVTLTIERKGVDKPFEKTITSEKIITAGAASSFGRRSLINAIKGNFDEARKDAEKAYALNPDDGWAKSAISFIYIIDSPPLAKEGKITEAIKILSTKKDSPFDRLLEALAYSKMGDLKKSFDTYTSIPEDYLQTKNVFHQQFRNAVLESLKPYVESKKETAKSLEAKGQYREALKEYEELLKIPDEKEAKEIRSHVAMLIKARPDIAQLSEEARRHAMRAETSTKEGKFEDAVTEYKEAIKIAPFFPQLYKAIALNYEALKDYRQAIKNMNIYLDLYPDAPDARAAKDQIYKWEYMMEKGGK